MRRRAFRRFKSNVMTALLMLSVLIAVLPLVFILVNLIIKGAGSLSIDFFTKMPAPAGESGGGVAHAAALPVRDRGRGGR